MVEILCSSDNSKKNNPQFSSRSVGGLRSETPRTAKQEKSILKVAVLSEPYFPKQKLSVRFNSVVLNHMELEDLSEGTSSSTSINRGGIA